MAADLRADLHDLATQHGSASDLLAHMLSPAKAQRHGPGAHRLLFADAATLAADPVLAEPTVHAARTLARHLADVIRRGQADGDIRADADPDAAAWLLLSVLSAQPSRMAAIPGPDRIEAAIAELALSALAPAHRPAPPPGE